MKSLQLQYLYIGGVRRAQTGFRLSGIHLSWKRYFCFTSLPVTARALNLCLGRKEKLTRLEVTVQLNLSGKKGVLIQLGNIKDYTGH